MSFAAVPRLICTPSRPISLPTASAAVSAVLPIDQSHAPILNRRWSGAANNGASRGEIQLALATPESRAIICRRVIVFMSLSRSNNPGFSTTARTPPDVQSRKTSSFDCRRTWA